MTNTQEFEESIITVLEKVLEFTFRPSELNGWSDHWFGAHTHFAYEFLLYTVASILKCKKYEVLNTIVKTNYLVSEDNQSGEFERFTVFWNSAPALKTIVTDGDKTFIFPAAEFIRRNSTRKDLSFGEIAQADLLCHLVALVDGLDWLPQTYVYEREVKKFPFFLHAAQHRYFTNIATILGYNDANKIREAAAASIKKWNPYAERYFRFGRSPVESLNLANLNTIE